MKNRTRLFSRWFLVSGCLGVLVALTLMATTARHVVGPTVLLVLWPASIAGAAGRSPVGVRGYLSPKTKLIGLQSVG